MNFDSIIVNGDSYTAPTGDYPVYSDWLQQHFDCPTINLAELGSSNDRILRSSVEHLSRAQNPLVIIGWSFIRRIEVWYYGNNHRILSRMPDQSSEEHLRLRLVTLDWLLNNNEATLEQKALINGDQFVHKQLMDFYTDLYLFSSLLKARDIKYLFFSAAKNSEIPVQSFPAIANLDIVKAVTTDPNIYHLHQFSIMDWAEQQDPECAPVTRHLSAVGHEKFSQQLIRILESCA